MSELEINASMFDLLSPEEQDLLTERWANAANTVGAISVDSSITDEPMGYDELDRPIGYYNHDEPVGEEEASRLLADKAVKLAEEKAAAEAARITGIYNEVMDRKDQELADKDEQLAAQEKRIEWLKRDELTKELIRKGLHDEFMHNPELVEEFAAPIEILRRGEDPVALGMPIFGVVFGDLRGVKAANTVGGMPLGDAFIGGGMKAFSEQLGRQSRQKERRHEDSPEDGRRRYQRRAIDPKYPDIPVRYGGDEIAAIARNIKSDESLEVISGRLEPTFSVAAVKKRYDEQHIQESQNPGSVEFIAPYVVGIATASIVELNWDEIKIDGEIDGHIMYKIFEKLCDVADEKQNTVKQQQYDEMWDSLLGAMLPEIREVAERPDDRKLIEIYWRTFFSDYVENPYKYLLPDDVLGASS